MQSLFPVLFNSSRLETQAQGEVGELPYILYELTIHTPYFIVVFLPNCNTEKWAEIALAPIKKLHLPVFVL